ncbi:MAG: CDP-alcohol phosphatidyltransferase family protein [Actinomycetota bacterium]|nr:CDP-alcohol phosphatidyltransferase family protein [Actinomycetota bacterium]
MGETAVTTDRVLTVPNALSALRLLGVPLFLWLILEHHDGWALVLLMISGFTDYLDGKIARRYNLISKVGQLLDPAADRLYILATLLGLAWRGVVPWWLVAVLLGREVFIAMLLPILKTRGYTALPVHFLGKAATFCLLYAFPLLLIGQFDNVAGDVAQPIGWAFAYWGTGLYWVAGILYAVQTRQVVRTLPRVARAAA